MVAVLVTSIDGEHGNCIGRQSEAANRQHAIAASGSHHRRAEGCAGAGQGGMDKSRRIGQGSRGSQNRERSFADRQAESG